MMKIGSHKFLMGLIGAVSLAVLAVAGCSRNQGDSSVTNPNPDPFHPVGTIQGVVMDTITNQPIVGAIVSVDLKSTKTDKQGSYVLKDVPATSDAHGLIIYGEYTMEVDLSKAYTQDENGDVDIDMRKDGGVRYPRISYEYVSVNFTSLNDTECAQSAVFTGDNAGCNTNSNHDTPVDHLVANRDVYIGKLACTVTGKVYGCDANTSLQAADFATTQAAEVRMNTEDCTNNTGSGCHGTLLGQTTTGADGSFTFENVECGQVGMELTAAQPGFDDPQRDDSIEIDSPEEDFATLVLDLEHTSQIDPDKGAPLHLCANDSVGPKVISIVPEPGSDLGPNDTGEEVILTFHEPVHQTPLTSVSQAGVNGLYDYIDVNYDGNKGGNIPYTLEWRPAGCEATDSCTQLVITFVTGASSLYNVTIQNLTSSGRFTDAAGNQAQLGVCPIDAPSPWSNIEGGSTDDDCAVYFSTFGGNVPDAPNITLVNEDSLDEGTPAQVGSYDWNTTAGAKTYNMYCRRIQVWEDGTTQEHPYLKVTGGNGGTVTGSSATVDFDIFADGANDSTAFVENYEVAYHFECFVRGVNSDGEEGDDSNHVTAEDKIGPQLDPADAGWGSRWLCGSGAVSGGLPTSAGALCSDGLNIDQLIVPFNENLREGTAETTTNYTFQNLAAGATAAIDTTAANKPVYNPATNLVLLNLSDTLAPAEMLRPVIRSGPNGKRETADGGDTLLNPGMSVGQGWNAVGLTTALCVHGGNGGSDSIPQGDDQPTGSNIDVGPNGLCETPANNSTAPGTGRDIQVVQPVGGLNTGRGAGVCGIEAAGAGDDVTENAADVDTTPAAGGGLILTGADGQCDTDAAAYAAAATPGTLWVGVGASTPNTAMFIGSPGDSLDTTTLNDVPITPPGDDVWEGSSIKAGPGILDINGNAHRSATSTPTGNNVMDAGGNQHSEAP
jgi:hypothetical protein